MEANGDALTECPYDATHLVTNRTLCKHLIKCRENHKGHRKVACKFDKTHLVPRPELTHHLSICPGRYLLDRELQLKAAAGASGVLSGNVSGPQIVTSYIDNDEEDWDSASGFDAPIAYFNRKEMDNEEGYENNRPFVVPDGNDQARRYGNVQSSSETFRFPVTSPSVTKVVEKSTLPRQPAMPNQVYLFSFAQAANKGWGRGRGISKNQAYSATLNNVGAVRPLARSPVYHHGPVSAAGNSQRMNIMQPPGAAVDRYSYDNNFYSNRVQTLRHQSPPGSTFTEDQCYSLERSHPSHWNQRFKHHLEQQVPDLEHTYESEISDSSSEETLASERHKKLPISQDAVSQVCQGQKEAPTLPKGRGYNHGLERLRPPSSSYSGAIKSQLDSWKIATSVREPQRIGKEDKNNHNITIKGGTGTDYTQYKSDDLRKMKRKLEKKLKQITVLEQKLMGGTKLSEEEESKLEKKNEIVMLTEKIAKLL